MRERNKPSESNSVAVLTIITGEDAGLVSATLTYRQPSLIEQAGARWSARLLVKRCHVHVIGRGVEISGRKLRGLIGAMMEMSPLAGPAQRVERKSQASEPEPYSGKNGVDFDNDPLWLRIKAIAAGGAL